MKNNNNSIDLTIIIPIFNEEDNIQPLNNKLLKSLYSIKKKFEIIYVDDGSSDKSFQNLAQISKQNPTKIKIIKFRRNYGQTAALMAGFDFAKGDIIIPLDGDLQNDPVDIKKLLDKLNEGYDVVSGWRKFRKDSKLARNLPSFIANKLISYISGVSLHDYGCTLKAYKKTIIEDVRLYGEMHRFIPIYASWNGAKVTEIPVNHHPRVAGQSKYGINRTFKVVLDLMLIKFFSSYGNKPIYIFGGFGFICVVLSIIFLLYAFYLKLSFDTSFVQTPLPILSSMFFLLGVMSVFLGFISDIVMRIYYESQDKKTYSVERKDNI